MNNTTTGGQAFPIVGPQHEVHEIGMNLRQYAAIKLKVPDSGTDWLDAMIRESLRNEFAAKAMQGIIMHPQGPAGLWDEAAQEAYKLPSRIGDTLVYPKEK